MLRIKEIRKRKKITAKEIADHVNVAESTMSLYENGKREPDYNTLLKIADFLDVSIDALFGNEDPNSTKENPKESLEEQLKVALFGGGTEVTDEMWLKIKSYAEFLKHEHGRK